MELDALKWDAAGLLTVVVQDRLSGDVRMAAYADREALAATLRTGQAHFFSRSRGRLWRKGETSGHVLHVREVWVDCDGDALLYLADPEGPSCHTGAATCFSTRLDRDRVAGDGARGRAVTAGVDEARDGSEGGCREGTGAGAFALPEVRGPSGLAAPLLMRLWAALENRRTATGTRSYTRTLLEGGPATVATKVREEADELARALEGETPERVVAETADLVYHALVGLLSRGVRWRDVEVELARRFGVSGHEEKAARRQKG
jgi:phosphoribosyl-ATP pyrophosphohydrolase/phosphoribosyl-AMP cyclohydrolase